ncbi:MAG: GNAT family N-acetyltransferase [Planctomycetota bacterium]
MNDITIRSCCELDPQQWDSFVRGHPNGEVFHTSGFLRALSDTPGHEPIFLAAFAEQEDGEEIVALLAAASVTVGPVFTNWTTRSLMYSEPLSDGTALGNAGLKKLIEKHDQMVSRFSLFSEVRSLHEPGTERLTLERCGYEYLEYFNYLQDLSGGMERVAMGTPKVARKVNASLRKGAEVLRCSSTSKDCIRMAYEVIAESYRRARVPLADYQLFLGAAQQFGDDLSVRLLRYGDDMVASSIGLVYKQRFFAWYNGTLRPSELPASSAVLVWDEMSEACERGLTQYDFGGAGWPGEDYGPRTFKARFKGQLVNYGRYRKVSSRLRLNVARAGYRIFRGAISPSPGTTQTTSDRQAAG